MNFYCTNTLFKYWLFFVFAIENALTDGRNPYFFVVITLYSPQILNNRNYLCIYIDAF
jgi:hypothetical protein